MYHSVAGHRVLNSCWVRDGLCGQVFSVLPWNLAFVSASWFSTPNACHSACVGLVDMTPKRAINRMYTTSTKTKQREKNKQIHSDEEGAKKKEKKSVNCGHVYFLKTVTCWLWSLLPCRLGNNPHMASSLATHKMTLVVYWWRIISARGPLCHTHTRTHTHTHTYAHTHARTKWCWYPLTKNGYMILIFVEIPFAARCVCII